MTWLSDCLDTRQRDLNTLLVWYSGPLGILLGTSAGHKYIVQGFKDSIFIVCYFIEILIMSGGGGGYKAFGGDPLQF